MAISKKHRRSISVDGTTYLWWVVEDLENDFAAGIPMLTVASEDRQLLVRYGLRQPDVRRHTLVLGPRFQGLPDRPGPWRRYLCPAFDEDGIVTPRHVADFIRWCIDPSASSAEVDYRGRPIAAPT